MPSLLAFWSRPAINTSGWRASPRTSGMGTSLSPSQAHARVPPGKGLGDGWVDGCFVGSVSGQARARKAGCVGKGLPMFVFYREGFLFFPFFCVQIGGAALCFLPSVLPKLCSRSTVWKTQSVLRLSCFAL